MADPVESWFDKQAPEQATILRALRALITQSNADVSEAIKWSRPCYTANGPLCYLFAAKGHVSLGFNQGAFLPDSNGLLEGDGKGMRHVKFRSAGDIDSDVVNALIAAALDKNAELAGQE
ncbi:MAG: DUF1801 domain-containing protein [Pseudomonadota bacterium]